MRAALEHCLHDGITHEEPATDQPVDKGLGIVVIGIWPRRATQPEGGATRLRQVGISEIQNLSWRQMGQKDPQPKVDAHKFPLRPLDVHRCRLRLWTAHREHGLALVLGHDYFPAALRLREKRARALTVRTPDPFHKR